MAARDELRTPTLVLLDPGGEELFRGASLLSSSPPAPPEPDEEPCPDTVRSSVWVRAEVPSGPRPIAVTIAGEDAEDDGFEAA